MKKTVFLIVFCILFSVLTVYSQNTKSDVARTKIFTCANQESIVKEECVVASDMVEGKENYILCIKSGTEGKYSYLINGKKYADVVPFSAKLSPDGNQWSYIKKFKEEYLVVINGKEYGPYKDAFNNLLKSSSVSFSANGKWGFFAKKTDDNYIIMIDGKEQGVFTNVTSFSYCYDGSTWGYIAEKDGVYSIVINGKKAGGTYTRGNFLVFSSDGKKWAAIIEEGTQSVNKYLILNNNEKFGPYYKIYPYPLFNGQNWACGINDNEVISIIVNGKKFLRYKDQVDKLTISQNGDNFAYSKEEGSNKKMFLNGKSIGLWGDIYSFYFILDDSNNWVYNAMRSLDFGKDIGANCIVTSSGEEIDRTAFHLVVAKSRKNIYWLSSDDNSVTFFLNKKEIKYEELEEYY
ncbi:MAG: hypothetical protein A2086_13945 [Spirochaetes bacterium GWD1_27_9]|nr:MAG: hypothetical protein A2Z98_17865 [Spirochaetes bacterium GWB1_27_13]OHD24555.1 MAG: hypothetical protein A2Y34_18975 [Spirochaetes bacterium GWC1_27_15]OHD38278.1 MAG: hypothetical protein A2086_13945 [Spirochaetes bacterium GWD1_27_9]